MKHTLAVLLLGFAASAGASVGPGFFTRGGMAQKISGDCARSQAAASSLFAVARSFIVNDEGFPVLSC